MFRSCVVLALVVVAVSSLRSKRQISPAVALEDRLSPLFMGAMGYDSSTFKRSAPNLKRHISPSFDVEEDMGNMRALLDIGKRQVSVAGDVDRHLEMYNRLFAAGKKRSALAPSQDIEQAWAMRDFLQRAGR